MASIQCKNDGVRLTFPVVLRGIACSYDFRCRCREVMVSSLSMFDLINTILDTIIMIKSVKLDEVNTGDSTGFMDKIWRTTLKIPESPKKKHVKGSKIH